MQKFAIFVSLCGLSGLLGTLSVVLASSADFIQEKLFELDARFVLRVMDNSPGGHHVIWIEASETEKTMRVVVDGLAGPWFDTILMTDPARITFSPDGHRLAYVASRKNRFLVVVDGVPGPEFDDISVQVPTLFSPDGRHIVYGGLHGSKAMLVVDGQLRKEYDLAPVRPAFSPDSQHFAFVAQRVGLNTLTQWVVLDEAPGPEFDGVGNDAQNLLFSPDSRRFAYSIKQGAEWRIVLDGRAQSPGFDGVGAHLFSPDSRRLAYSALKGGKAFWIIDGTAGPEFAKVGTLVFSPNSAHIAYAAQRTTGFLAKKKFVIVKDGEPGPEFDDLGNLYGFSPDNRLFAYLAEVGRKWRVILDGSLGPEFDEVSSAVHFTPDSSHYAYSARRDKQWVMVMDGALGPTFDFVSIPFFGPDGHRLAYFAARGAKQMIVVDSRPDPEFEQVEMSKRPVFSPDGRHLAYIAYHGGGWVPVLDGVFGPEFEGLGQPFFASDQRVIWFGMRQHAVYRVYHRIP